MRCLFWSIYFLLFGGTLNAQCDSAEVREWLRTMNRDTICFAKHGWCADSVYNSRMWFINDSTFTYYYHPKDAGRTIDRYYENYRLFSYEINRAAPGDTDFHWSYYAGNCIPTYYIVKVVNDSLSTSEEGGEYCDYYQEIVRDEYGRIRRKHTVTHFTKRGKLYRRSVYIDRTKVFDRRNVRVNEVDAKNL